MFTHKTLDGAHEGIERWSKRTSKVSSVLGRKNQSACASSVDIKPIYTPEDIKDLDFDTSIGYPGEYPFTRGCQNTMYRERIWTMRMFSGFGSAEDTNKRWHMLLTEGETGLSTAFDFPTLMGYDSDSPKALGECGKCGVAIDTLADFEVLTDKIPLDKVTTSMTINPPASVMWAMYIVAAEKQGAGCDKIGGTIQNDMLKEFIAQKTFMCPLEPSVRLISDTIEFGIKYVPRWNTISISGYHIREAGSTAVQELAFTLADGIAYVQDVIDRKKLDNKQKTMVGVNKYFIEKAPIPFLKIDEKLLEEQINRLQEVKRVRDGRRVAQTLNDLRVACQSGENVMPYVIEAVREYATEKEICDVYRDVFGEYHDPGYF